VALGRRAYVAELDSGFAALAHERLRLAAELANPEEEELTEGLQYRAGAPSVLTLVV
jgi:hypothetical protein